MVFYYFGPDPSSWAFGNDTFSLANNLPVPIQAAWDKLGEPLADKQMAGTRILWMSSAPNGKYAIMTNTGDLLSNEDDMLAAVIQQLKERPGTLVKHVCFSPRGGWFVKYEDGSAQISGAFPESFSKAIMPLIDLTGSNAHARQHTGIDCIWFGRGDSWVLAAGSALLWEGISETLATSLQNISNGKLGAGYIPGSGTVLCPWSFELFYIRVWCPPYSPQHAGASLMEVPSEHVEIMGLVASGLQPPRDLIERVILSSSAAHSASQPPPSSDEPSSASQPNSVSRSSSVTSALQLPEVPFNLRRRYEQEFDRHSNSGTELDGSYAAQIFFQSGLPRKTLSEIWEVIDQDSNGKLDKEEFVQAMWQIDTRLTGENTKIRWAGTGIKCDGCAKGMNIGEPTYFCSICAGGDYDLCQSCYHRSKTCPHQMSSVTIQLPKEVNIRQLSGDYAVCDGCGLPLRSESIVYWCKSCNAGDFDICETCWEGRRSGQCQHPLLLSKLQAAKAGEVNLSTPSVQIDDPYSPSSSIWDAPDTRSSMTPSTDFLQFDNASEVDKLSKKFNDTKLKDSLLSSIVSEKPNVKWEDVAGLEAAKAELQEAIIFPLRFPQMFRGKRQARRALLLYGPPGTGKSYLAKAVATEVDHTLFSVSSGDVMSKWLGESEGLMRQLFILAREKKPSIIFIDEIDALCGKRDSGGANGEDTARLKTEFLVQMDGLGNNNDGVFVLAATNLPWSLDPAVRRRFQKRIHVPLPDEEARKELFKVHLGDMAPTISGNEHAFQQLAQSTKGFSGSDIANLVQDALMMPIRKVHSATHFRKFRDATGEWYTPCNPNDPGATPLKWSQVPGKQLKEPSLLLEDLYRAVEKTKPSVGEDEVKQCSEWTQQFGMEGA